MNQQNIEALIGRLECIEHSRFTMHMWSWNRRAHTGATPSRLIHDCDTAGCIGGWTNAMFPPTPGEGRERGAQNALGLTAEQADALFYPGSDISWDLLTVPVAVATLKNLIITGEVSWTI